MYKLIGPALIKQDLKESQQNVDKRIEFITNEMYVAASGSAAAAHAHAHPEHPQARSSRLRRRPRAQQTSRQVADGHGGVSRQAPDRGACRARVGWVRQVLAPATGLTGVRSTIRGLRRPAPMQAMRIQQQLQTASARR